MEQYHLLLVDYEENNLKAITESLKGIPNVKFLVEKDGKSALSLLTHYPLDIIISNIYLPKLGGIKLCKMIREKRSFDDLFIIGLTSYKGESNSPILQKAGYDVFIAIPSKIERLRKVVCDYLKYRTMIVETQQKEEFKVTQ
ncbi:MAG: hypothetical protein BAJALOKI2v1_340042 [Promethearchaeota archaeon]|nr:MAG: hypothetical protein BAJALOKI2v1_340042 [Candidatus Lokiarchaeota archaeon]